MNIAGTAATVVPKAQKLSRKAMDECPESAHTLEFFGFCLASSLRVSITAVATGEVLDL